MPENTGVQSFWSSRYGLSCTKWMEKGNCHVELNVIWNIPVYDSFKHTFQILNTD